MFVRVIVDITHSNVDKIFDYRVPIGMNVEVGARVSVPFGRQKIEGFVIDTSETTDVPCDKIKDVIKVLDKLPPLSKEILEVYRFVRAKYHALSAEVLRLMIPSQMRGGKVKEVFKNRLVVGDLNYDDAIAAVKQSAKNQIGLIESVFGGENDYTLLAASYGYGAINALVDKDILRVEAEHRYRVPYEYMETDSIEKVLTKNQLNAVDKILTTDKKVSLIRGVTGSGKTEIYLTCIADYIKRGFSAIFLVPEIALTPQMVARLRGKFGDEVAILHSGLSMGERFDEWWRLRSGEAKIAVGARSCVFAPLENVGIIIIDEEHDQSYFSESSPRYSTLEIAKFRVSGVGKKLVLGSATPSIESYNNAKTGVYELIEIEERVKSSKLPYFEIVDMKREVKCGNKTIISSVLKDKLDKCLANGEQAMLFLNRRGFAAYYQCLDCGYVAKCDDCDVSLTYHKDERALKCHYCGAKYQLPKICPECGGVHFKQGGIGTERIVEEVQTLFPKVNILRLDNDTTAVKDGAKKILEEFRQKKAQILVGTQMIAKGHDFPLVTVVGILDADMSLYFSDYRSGERTFQLITQVAGRSGRGDTEGVVVLQTYTPSNLLFDMARKYDYVSFFDYELNLRKISAFPPFATIVRILVSGEDERDVFDATKRIMLDVRAIKAQNEEGFVYLNSMKAPVKRIMGATRYQIIARIAGKDTDEIIDRLYEAVDKNKSSKVISYLELNPSNMY